MHSDTVVARGKFLLIAMTPHVMFNVVGLCLKRVR